MYMYVGCGGYRCSAGGLKVDLNDQSVTRRIMGMGLTVANYPTDLPMLDASMGFLFKNKKI